MNQRRNLKRNLKIFELNENKNTIHQNLWDAEKAVLQRKFIVFNVHIRKEERTKINNLSFHLKKLEKGEKIVSKVSRTKEIVRIRAEISEIKRGNQ